MTEDLKAQVVGNGAVPSGWLLADFIETCHPVPDGGRKLLRKYYQKNGMYPVVDQGEDLVGGFSDNPSMLFQGKTPVIAFGDHTRRFKLINWPFVVGADGVKLIGSTAAWDPKCLWYFLRALKFEDRGYSRHFQFLRKSKLPLPPLAEQARIIDALDELFSDLDAGVAALERVSEKLKLYRASVLNTAVKHWTFQQAGEVLLRPLSDVIGEIGQGWSPRCSLTRAPRADEWAIIKTTAVQSMRYLDEECKPLPSHLKPRAGIEVRPGDMLMTRKGPRQRAGVTCLVTRTRPRLMVCDTVYRFRCNESVIVPAYLELVLNSPSIVAEIDKRKSGINDSGVSLTHRKLYSLQLPVPVSRRDQEAIVEAVEDQLSVIDHLEADLDAKLKSAQSLRQAILRHAFTGQLVPQNPNDEPASELLKRIAAEREARRAPVSRRRRAAS
jgi:restriction endonuclease S subunit